MTAGTRDPALDPSIDPNDLDDAEWQAILSPIEHRILRHSGTEPAGSGRYLQSPGPGAFHCAGCGNRLYGADHKFHSGCGWPSFFQEVESGAISTHEDRSFFMRRTEMRCARCGGHLGHIFRDAPQTPTGLRHCVNGFAIVHVPQGEDPRAVFTRHRASQR